MLTQAQRSYYLYAEEGLIAESQQAISHSNGQSVSTTATPALVNQYGPKPNNPYTTGVLFVKTLNSNNQSVYAYYHHDHLNTPIQATDKHGKVVWAGRYSAFGQVANITPTATGDNPVIESSLRFPGQIEDAETGLYYNWRRYYDPEVGRYVTQDPIGLEGGMNLYAYVGGDPVNGWDSTGEFAQFFLMCARSTACRSAVIAGVLWAWNAFDTANDIVDTVGVLSDGCASNNDKLKTIGWLVLGMVDPSPGNVARKVVSIDNNAIISALEKGGLKSVDAIIEGRIPVVSRTAVKEFLKGGGDINALRQFLTERGGRLAAAGSEAEAAALRAQAEQMGRSLGLEDSRIAASAAKEGASIITNDKRFGNFLNAVGIDGERF